MEKGFRLLQCRGCPKKLRINGVNEAMYGKTFDVTCPSCQTVSQVTIPVPAVQEAPAHSGFPQQPAGFPFGNIFGDAYGDIFGQKK